MKQIIESLNLLFESLFGSSGRRNPLDRRGRRPLPDRVIPHECGHACLAWLSAAVISVDRVTFHKGGGATTTATFDKSHPDYPLEDLVYTLGGLVGEMLVLGRAHTRGIGGEDKTDLSVALELAEAIARKMPLERIERQWRGRLAEPSFDVASMFVERPRREVAALLNLAYRRGKYLLSENRAGFDRLRRLARGRRSLTRRDIESQFGPRPWGGTPRT